MSLSSWIIALYGGPQSDELGALGQGSPSEAAKRLREQADEYEGNGRRPVVPALELIAVIANAAPGDDGAYNARLDAEKVRDYLEAAREANALLLLDIQPGRSDFLSEVKALREFLEEPNVGVALDPEWSMDSGEVPGEQVGETDAETINGVSDYLADLVREKGLPQKVLLIHRFTGDDPLAVEDSDPAPGKLRHRPGVGSARRSRVGARGDCPCSAWSSSPPAGSSAQPTATGPQRQRAASTSRVARRSPSSHAGDTSYLAAWGWQTLGSRRARGRAAPARPGHQRLEHRLGAAFSPDGGRIAFSSVPEDNAEHDFGDLHDGRRGHGRDPAHPPSRTPAGGRTHGRERSLFPLDRINRATVFETVCSSHSRTLSRFGCRAVHLSPQRANRARHRPLATSAFARPTSPRASIEV